jgi:hypothetical protein
MKQIAEKYPKAFSEASFYLWKQHRWEWDGIAFGNESQQLPFNAIFGVLVLEFFPKYGIEIERALEKRLIYRVWAKTGNNENIIYPHEVGASPEKAIKKAFEILEKQMESK